MLAIITANRSPAAPPSEQLAQRLGLSRSGPAPATCIDPGQPRVITVVAGVGGGVGTSTVAALLETLDVPLWTHYRF